jgi:hypothetical protein
VFIGDGMNETDVYRRLICRWDTYAHQNKDYRKGYVRRQKTLTEKELLRSLLSEHLVIGTYTINPEDQTCRNPVIDIDAHTDEEKVIVVEKTKAVYQTLIDAGMHPYIEVSSGIITDGAHIGLIMEPTPANRVRGFLDDVLKDIQDIEIFPKQTEVGPGSFGNLVKLPWQFNRRIQQRSEIVDPDTLEPMEREQAIKFMCNLENSVIPEEPCIQEHEDTEEQAAECVYNPHDDETQRELEPEEPVQQTIFKCGSCFQEVYRRGIKLVGDKGHDFRVYAGRELIFNGASDDEIHDFFSNQDDYNSDTTQKQIDNLRKKNMKPITCTKIKKTGFVEGDMCVGCVRKKKRNDEEKEDEEDDIPDDIKNEAMEIIYNGDPVKKILDTHQALHVGDESLAISLLVSTGIQSVKNSEGIHPKASGNSGKGKTHCCKTMLHLIPKPYKLKTTLSDKAIYYMDIKEGTVIFSDDVNLSEALEDVIKRATSSFQEGDTYTTLNKNREKQELTIPPRVVWWLTSVDDDQSLQLLNRQFGGCVDESEGQDMAVLDFQKNMLVSGEVALPENRDVKICRHILKDVKENLYNVLISYAHDIEWKDLKNRRNFLIFADIIKAFAVLRHRQRNKNENGELIANLEDFEDAKKLYLGRAKNQGTKLTDIELKFCMILHEHGETNLTRLQQMMGVSKGRISQILYGKGRNDSGLAYG